MKTLIRLLFQEPDPDLSCLHMAFLQILWCSKFYDIYRIDIFHSKCTSVIRVLYQALESTAFLVHPVLAAIAEDAVAAHSSVTDCA